MPGKEEVKKTIEAVFQQFLLQEEVGNRLSQFAVLALKSIILEKIQKLEKDET